jgi:soluble lytic murein transglycosylase-like protein
MDSKQFREPGSAVRCRCALPFAVALCVLACCLPGHAAAQVYTWKDADGITHISSTPPTDQNQGFRTHKIPCYAADPTCRQRNWEQVPLELAEYRLEIRDAARRHAVDESLIRAVIHAESAYRHDAVSPKGAQGLMQLMPATQRDLAVDDPYDPALNIDGGTRYLARLLNQFGGDVDLASAAYNAGPDAVRRHGGIPPYDETREYVRRVKILLRRYRQAGGRIDRRTGQTGITAQ